MRRVSTTVLCAVGAAIAVGMATALSPFAASSPDGLERVAEDTGFAGDGRLHELQSSSPVPDYVFPGIADERLATGVAGFVGTLGVLLCGIALAALMRRLARRPVGAST